MIRSNEGKGAWCRRDLMVVMVMFFDGQKPLDSSIDIIGYGRIVSTIFGDGLSFASRQAVAMRDVMTLDQLVEYLQMPKSTLYKLVQNGRVPGKKIGRQWRFYREAIDAWLSEASNKARKPSPARKKGAGDKK